MKNSSNEDQQGIRVLTKTQKRFSKKFGAIFFVCGKKKKSRNAKHRQNVPNCAKLMTNLCPLRKLMFNGFSRLKCTFSFSSSPSFSPQLSGPEEHMGTVGIVPNYLWQIPYFREQILRKLFFLNLEVVENLNSCCKFQIFT